VSQAYDHQEELDWPPWVAAIFGGIALVTGVGVAVQRVSVGQGLLRPILLVSLVLSPYILEIVGYVTSKPIALPRPLFPVPVVVGTALLLLRPTELDFAPFALVFVSAQMAAESDHWPGLTVALAGITLMTGLELFGPWDGAFIWIIGIVFGWFGGFSVHAASERAGELKRAYAQLEEAQAGLADKAAADERSRIAREVHDVIAHSLSVTMLHVTAARMALQRGNRTEDALDALREAEDQGRKSLAEIRRTVGLLGPEESAQAPPMPALTDLPKLITDFRNAGLDVTLSMDGDVMSLPPTAGLNLYRIVQESLTNAAKHSPGAKASVHLNITDDDIRLRIFNEVTNGHAADTTLESGRGLRGITERAVMLNGSVFAGQDAGAGGWVVFLAAPRPPA
jgi:signal transduction histidine kinase